MIRRLERVAREPRDHILCWTYPSWYATVVAVAWGAVELEPEVVEWIAGISDEQFGRVEFYIDLLADKGPLLDSPYTRQLRGKLRELRFYLGSTGDAVRISYYIARGRRIILLTVFTKQRRRERSEIERAERAMRRCIEEKHDAENERNV